MTALAVLSSIAKRWRLILEAALIVAIFAAHGLGKRKGSAAAHAEDAAKAAVAAAAAETRYRERELANERTIADVRRTYASTEATAKAADAHDVADLRSGLLRVRIPTTRRCPDTPATGSSAARADDPSTAELAPKAAADLRAIADDGDEAIRQLTALQEWARAAVLLCSPSAGKLSAKDF